MWYYSISVWYYNTASTKSSISQLEFIFMFHNTAALIIPGMLWSSSYPWKQRVLALCMPYTIIHLGHYHNNNQILLRGIFCRTHRSVDHLIVMPNLASPCFIVLHRPPVMMPGDHDASSGRTPSATFSRLQSQSGLRLRDIGSEYLKIIIQTWPRPYLSRGAHSTAQQQNEWTKLLRYTTRWCANGWTD